MYTFYLYKCKSTVPMLQACLFEQKKMTVRLFGWLQLLLFWNIHWRQCKYCKLIYGHLGLSFFETNTMIKLNQPLHQRTRQPVGGTDGSSGRAKHPWVFMLLIFFSFVKDKIKIGYKLLLCAFFCPLQLELFAQGGDVPETIGVNCHFLGRFQNPAPAIL